ncbi:MAG: tRNA/rRNA methyltransferase [Bacteroidales bacterium]
MNIHFILTEPNVPENIGAAARAIKTMGFNSLWIVNSEQYTRREAQYLAHGANDILNKVKFFYSFDEMLSELDFSIATTSKSRSIRYEYIEGNQLSHLLCEKIQIIKNTGIIFGREKYGLRNEELRKCDIISSIPQIINYPSLNLGQAVMLYSYLLSDFKRKKKKNPSEMTFEYRQKTSEYKAFKKKVENILPELGLDKETNIYGRIMESMARINQDDMHLLLSILNKIIDKKEKS